MKKEMSTLRMALTTAYNPFDLPSEAIIKMNAYANVIPILNSEATGAKANVMEVHKHACRIRDLPFGIDALELLFILMAKWVLRLLSEGRKREGKTVHGNAYVNAWNQS